MQLAFPEQEQVSIVITQYSKLSARIQIHSANQSSSNSGMLLGPKIERAGSCTALRFLFMIRAVLFEIGP
jgi:hypothetical protein